MREGRSFVDPATRKAVLAVGEYKALSISMDTMGSRTMPLYRKEYS